MGLFKNFNLKHMVQWFCDNCEAHLNRQEKFNTKTGRWVCTKCNYNNDVTAEYVGKGNRLQQKREIKRKNTECKFNGNISFEKFSSFAHSIAKQIKRLHVDVTGTFITGTVKTVSGIDSWDFKIDFNDFGEITGNYWWVYCENDDSAIPDVFVKKLTQLIVDENERFQSELINEIDEDEINESNSREEDKTIQEVYDTFNEEQKFLTEVVVDLTKNNITDSNEIEDYLNSISSDGVSAGKTIQEIFDTLNEEQKHTLYAIVGAAIEEVEIPNTNNYIIRIHTVINRTNIIVNGICIKQLDKNQYYDFNAEVNVRYDIEINTVIFVALVSKKNISIFEKNPLKNKWIGFGTAGNLAITDFYMNLEDDKDAWERVSKKYEKVI